MAGLATNNFPASASVAPGNAVSVLSGIERLAIDTLLPSGVDPQTAVATSFQVASAAAAMIYNSGTLSSNTATVNARSGVILTASLSTAAGSTYGFTIVNSLATTGQPVQLNLMSGSNTTGGAVIQSAAINNSGTVAVVLANNGTAALNGTMIIPFQVGSSV